MKTDILAFVEDPGAANYIAPLPGALLQSEYRMVVWAKGLAGDVLDRRGIPWQRIAPEWSAERILDDGNPAVVVVGTATDPHTLGLPLVLAARRRGLDTLGVVDAPINIARRFAGTASDPLAFAPDWIAVPNTHTRQAFIDLGMQADRVVIFGHPHYDYVRAWAASPTIESRAEMSRRLFPDRPLNRKIVVFVAEGNEAREPIDPDVSTTAVSLEQSRTTLIMKDFLAAVTKSKEARPYLVLRLHPKNRPDDYAFIEKQFDAVSRGGLPLEVIRVADLIVGLTSMMLLEAVLMRVPTLSILPNEVQSDWLPTIGAGLTPCVTQRDEIGPMVKQMLGNGAGPADREINRELPSGAISRIVDFLVKMISYNHENPRKHCKSKEPCSEDFHG